ncbi:MAG: hypothetical protein KA178_11295 [Alphaproteobacteria bacterium]|nr:hypothetical protein [Alphaproteobacteria bacterium]MBP7763076.1 hypothetical protein [Alphaproteobacteria bacterium]
MSFVVLGHRGMGPTARIDDLKPDFLPENTLAAFQKALDLGGDGIEFDVQLTGDGGLAVVHSDQLKRIAKAKGVAFQDAEGLCSKFNMSSLSSQDVGNNHTVPSFRGVLDFMVEQNPKHRLRAGNDLIINIELKSDGTAGPVYDVISEYIRDGRLKKENFIFNSFEWHRLRELRALDGDLKIMPAIKTVDLFGKENVTIPGWRVKEGTPYTPEGLQRLEDFHKEIGVYAFDCIIFDLRPEMVDFAERNGVGLFTSTSNENVNAGSIQGSLALMVDASTRLDFTGFRADNVAETRLFVDAIRHSKLMAQEGIIPQSHVEFQDMIRRTYPSKDQETQGLARGVHVEAAWQGANEPVGASAGDLEPGSQAETPRSDESPEADPNTGLHKG